MVSPSADNLVFLESWWLDAAAPDGWRELRVEAGDHVALRTAIVERSGRGGLRVVSNPPLTPTIGPWVRPLEGKIQARTRQVERLLEDLITQLPNADSIALRLSPDVTNGLPFHWAGFEQSTLYTHRLGDLGDPEVRWQGYDRTVRSAIKRAEPTITVAEDRPTDELLDLVDRTYRAQGRAPLTDERRALIRRLHEAARREGRGCVLSALDESAQAHASMFLVWDDQVTYYLVGGSDPALRQSGAPSLLFHHAFAHASHHSSIFDFEGSMVRPIARFFRSFGSTQTPYLRVTRSSARARLVETAGSIRTAGVSIVRERRRR